MAPERLGHDRWRFTLSDRAVTPAERMSLRPDLSRTGLDEALLDVYSATVSAGVSPEDPERTRPLLLRGFRGSGFAGLAVVLQCRLLGSRYLDSASLGAVVDALHLGIWFWDRMSIGTDGHSGPGVVAATVDRELFAEAATRWLAHHAGTGVVVEPLGAPAAAHDVVTSFAPAAVLVVGGTAPGDVPSEPGAGLELPGGSVERVVGALPADLVPALLDVLRRSTPPDPPVRGYLSRVVRATWALPAARHLVATVGGRPVGFQSVVVTGRQMSSLSCGVVPAAGGVDGGAAVLAVLRAHTARLAEELGLEVVHLGPALEPGVVRGLSLRPARLRFVSRWPPVRLAVRGLVPRSRISPDRLRLADVAVVGGAP